MGFIKEIEIIDGTGMLIASRAVLFVKIIPII